MRPSICAATCLLLLAGCAVPPRAPLEEIDLTSSIPPPVETARLPLTLTASTGRRTTFIFTDKPIAEINGLNRFNLLDGTAVAWNPADGRVSATLYNPMPGHPEVISIEDSQLGLNQQELDEIIAQGNKHKLADPQKVYTIPNYWTGSFP